MARDRTLQEELGRRRCTTAPPGKNGVGFLVVLVVLHAAAAGPAQGQGAAAPEGDQGALSETDGRWKREWHDFVGAWIHGKPTLQLRPRIELAKQRDLEFSQGYTMRTQIGYGTGSYRGFSVYGEMENVATACDSCYRDPTEAPNGMTVIADPPATEVNRAYLKFAREEWLGVSAIGGRDAILLDDARWIGNVDWRQNEQTYDGARINASLGVEGLDAMYGYIASVRRVFGNKGTGTRNFDSNSHLLHATFDDLSLTDVTGFVYLLDLRIDAIDDEGANSNATYGLRLAGRNPLSDALTLSHQLSYAYQTQYADAPIDYGAHYALVDLRIDHEKFGGFGAAYELLGSDDGKQRLITPLATLHGFNGWADVFLDNGGPNGLQDLHFYVKPKLPWGLKSRFIYHHFWNDETGLSLGDEIDGRIEKMLHPRVGTLLKAAYFIGTPDSGRADIWRVWLQLDFKI